MFEFLQSQVMTEPQQQWYNIKIIKNLSNLNKCSLCFWDQKGMSQCFRSPTNPFPRANAF